MTCSFNKPATAKWENISILWELINGTLIAVYAPVNHNGLPRAGAAVDTFYNVLERAFDKVSASDMFFLTDDFNVRVSEHKHQTSGNVVNLYALDRVNENG